MMGAGIDGWRILAEERKARREARLREIGDQEADEDRVTPLEWIGAAIVCGLLISLAYSIAKAAGYV